MFVSEREGTNRDVTLQEAYEKSQEIALLAHQEAQNIRTKIL